MVRAVAVFVALALAATACGKTTAFRPAQVERAFRDGGLQLERARELERRFHDAAGGARGAVARMLGKDVPLPERIYVAPQLPDEADFYVAVFKRPTKPEDVAGGEQALRAIRRQGLVVEDRANVIVVADARLRARVRRVLRRLG